MHSDLERLLSEDEAARAGVEAARSRESAQLEAVRGACGFELGTVFGMAGFTRFLCDRVGLGALLGAR